MRPILALILALLTVPLSGCLADDIWREPFDWEQQLQTGANIEGADAFAAAMQALGEQAADEGNLVVGQAEDLPDNVAFQNLREFLEQQEPGTGEQFEEAVRMGTRNASSNYAVLSGELAAAYSQVATNMEGPDGTFDIVAPERTTRLRLTLDVVVAQEAPQPGANPTPLGAIEVILTDPRGVERVRYAFDTSRSIQDQFITGTFGGTNEVRDDLAGTWNLTVYASGEGAWSVEVDTYQPEYDDYEWWQLWRSERRKVSGQ